MRLEILLPDPFLKDQNWAYLWINILKFQTACFYGMPSWGLSEHTKTKLQTTCFTAYKTFLKDQRSGTSLPASFSTWFFEEKYFCYILLRDPILLPGCLYFVRYCSICVTVCYPGCGVINFEVNHIFLIKPFFYMIKKSP